MKIQIFVDYLFCGKTASISRKGPDTIRSLWAGRGANTLSEKLSNLKAVDYKMIGEGPLACRPAERLLTMSGPFLDGRTFEETVSDLDFGHTIVEAV